MSQAGLDLLEPSVISERTALVMDSSSGASIFRLLPVSSCLLISSAGK